MLLIALLSPAVQARAAQWAYGGRGEDALLEITEARGGLFAVGRTDSDDGDLSVRTRTGEAGWAMLTAEDGARRWSYVSAHAGLARMTCPAALEDGRYSLVLTDDGAQRGEWILLDGRGSLLLRTPVSAALAGDSETDEVKQMLLSDQTPAALTLLLARPQTGMLRTATIDENGGVRVGAAFEGGETGRLVSDGHGGLAWVGEDAGGLRIVRLEEDVPGACGVRLEGVSVRTVEDALMQDDGSIVCCGTAEGDAAGYLARVNREGEALICAGLELPQRHLCQTETGFAVYGEAEGGASVVFVDEDGGLQGVAADAPADALDMAGLPGGAALLTQAQGRRQRQAIVTTVQGAADASGEERHAAQAGQALRVGQSVLRCEAMGADGVRVTLMDGSGREAWSTRIPIHTAADALEWRCAAQMEGGGVLLGGRYLSGEGEAQRQQGAVALLGADGVLRRMETIEGAGAVLGMEETEDGVLLHCASGALPALGADTAIPYRP